VDRKRLRQLLDEVRTGDTGVNEAIERLRSWPLDELGFATLDTHRALRRGFPEVIYGPGKTEEQIVEIVRHMHQAGQTVLVTRVDAEVHAAVKKLIPKAEYHKSPRAIVVRSGRRKAGKSGIVVMTAGTSDLPAGDEAALTAELMGNKVARINDVGIAGIHRLTPHLDTLLKARVVVVVAGMEGALPSVVSGLTDCPVVGVPTSIGYGAGGKGQAALLAMLNSCASGLTVVNIDNGFGAGYAAALINRLGGRKSAK
jgi:NCAIR mutase (PurE)-related protein